MEILQLNYPVYQFQCDESLLQDIEKDFDKLTWMRDEHNCNTDQFHHENLFTWFHDCINQVQSIHMNTTFSLEIVACWVNKNTKLMKSPIHNHVNSILSGVMYFSDENTSPMVLYVPDPYLYTQHKQVLHLSDKEPFLKTKIYPKRGLCVLFPSSFPHETLVHKGSTTRYSIAFNTFPSGTITTNPTGRLTIKTTHI